MNKKVMLLFIGDSKGENILPRTNFTRKYLTVNFFQTTVYTTSQHSLIRAIAYDAAGTAMATPLLNLYSNDTDIVVPKSNDNL